MYWWQNVQGQVRNMSKVTSTMINWKLHALSIGTKIDNLGRDAHGYPDKSG